MVKIGNFMLFFPFPLLSLFPSFPFSPPFPFPQLSLFPTQYMHCIKENTGEKNECSAHFPLQFSTIGSSVLLQENGWKVEGKLNSSILIMGAKPFLPIQAQNGYSARQQANISKFLRSSKPNGKLI